MNNYEIFSYHLQFIILLCNHIFHWLFHFKLKCEVKLSHDLEIPQFQVDLKNKLQILRKPSIILQVSKYFNFVLLAYKNRYIFIAINFISYS